MQNPESPVDGATQTADNVNTLTIEFTQMAEDVLHMFRVFDSRATLSLRTRLRVIAVALVAGLLVGYGTTDWAWVVIFPMITWLVGTFQYRMQRPNQARSMAKDPNFAGPYRFIFSDDDVQVASPTMSTRARWTHYQSAIESPVAFLLVYGVYSFQTVPKRAFADERQMEMLRGLIRRKIGTLETTKVSE